MKDFIPYIAQYQSILAELLTKAPLTWSSNHFATVIILKEISKDLPTLQIPFELGKRIL